MLTKVQEDLKSTKVKNGSKMLKIQMSQMLSKMPSMHVELGNSFPMAQKSPQTEFI
jgi:hypothetical protein